MKPMKHNYPKTNVLLLDSKYLALYIYKEKIYHLEHKNGH